MFDGNFRSNKREVNLSGNRRRGGRSGTAAKGSPSTSSQGRSSNNRNDILRAAEVQRKQRQEATRRDKAARLIQRWIRRCLVGLHCVRDLSVRIGSTITNNDNDPNAAATSLCVSFRPRFLQETSLKTNRKELLVKYYQGTKKDAGRSGGADDTNNDDDDDDNMTDADSSTWFSKRRILLCALEEIDPKDSTDMTTNLFHLVQSLWDTSQQPTTIDDGMFLTLCRACQRIYLGRNDSTRSPTTEGIQQSSSQTSSDFYQGISDTLLSWAIQSSVGHRYRRALLATIVLSGPVDLAKYYAKTSSESEFDDKWFGPLIETISMFDQSTGGEEAEPAIHGDIMLRAISKNLQNGTEEKLLSNLLEITKSPRLLIILHHILSQPQNSSLKVAAALLVRGESLENFNDVQDQSNHSNNADQYDDTDDTDDDEPMDGGGIKDQSQPSSSKRARGSTSYYSRNDLQTLGKLDKVYHDRIYKARSAHIGSFTEQVKTVATKIVKSHWVEWGVKVMNPTNDVDTVALSSIYLETIGYIMQGSSDLRPKMKLNVLSPVAFNRTIMESLWYGIKNDTMKDRWLGLTLFGDLFSHYLMPLSDVDFRRLHTAATSAPTFGGGNVTMDAGDIVSVYEKALYEVYWTIPVVADDIEMDNPRGRFILSGTKLWNMLYERWNRMTQHKFCSAKQWCFPHLVSIGNDRAVVSTTERMDEGSDDEDVDSDSDDDDDDDRMAVDGDRNRSTRNNDTTKAEAESDALAGSFRDPKMARILTSIPQALPFGRRVKLFHTLIKNDKRKALQAAGSRRAMMAMAGQRDDDPMAIFDGGARERVKIRRADLYADSMEQLNGLGARLKNQIQVSFVNQHGTEEAGIDGGGVFKEFLDDLIKDAFLPESAQDDSEGVSTKGSVPQLFVETPVQTLTVNLGLTSRDSRLLSHYSFLGRVLGKAVYESILVEPQFALPFLNQCLGKSNTIEDLKNYDEEYYANLNKVRKFTKEELELSGLTFELTFGGSNGSTPRTVELESGGRSKAVTQKNAFKYTNLVANELLNRQGAEQTKAFLAGFRDLIPVSWVRLFSATELQKIISGDDTVRGIDVQGLRRSTTYLSGYHESQPYIRTFWDVLEKDFTPDQQRKFLKFMTSCSRQPLLGFSSLQPAPSIQQIRLRDEDKTKNSRLPTSQTCMNLLKLPNYDNRALLKEKLLAAVEAGAGFELT